MNTEIAMLIQSGKNKIDDLASRQAADKEKQNMKDRAALLERREELFRDVFVLFPTAIQPFVGLSNSSNGINEYKNYMSILIEGLAPISFSVSRQDIREGNKITGKSKWQFEERDHPGFTIGHAALSHTYDGEWNACYETPNHGTHDLEIALAIASDQAKAFVEKQDEAIRRNIAHQKELDAENERRAEQERQWAKEPETQNVKEETQSPLLTTDEQLGNAIRNWLAAQGLGTREE